MLGYDKAPCVVETKLSDGSPVYSVLVLSPLPEGNDFGNWIAEAETRFECASEKDAYALLAAIEKFATSVSVEKR